MADEMDIQIRCSSGKAFGWRGSKASSVAEFKDQIAGDAAVPAAEQRLIYKGRALQDAQLLAELDIEDGGTVHLLRAVGAPAPRAGAAPRTRPAAAASTSSAAAWARACPRPTCSGASWRTRRP
ncbi:hypothetical protein JL720_4519 [Aureococcus anophagefferens]|nr:hypothetical protein JL720_4519 [Aureococcus anophagefferens]